METILERQRHAHEEIERLEQAVTDRLLAHPRTIRDRLQLDHEIAEMLETIQLRSHTLRELYADPDAARSKEVAQLSASGGLDTFYEQLGTIKDFHKKYPDHTTEDLAAQYEIDLPDPNYPVDPEDRVAKMFSGEESYGRYLDMNSHHAVFQNLKRNRTIPYSRYLDIFDSFDSSAFPVYVKQDVKYGQYLADLLSYLESFYKRTVPLDDHEKLLQELDSGFEIEWKAGKLSGTEDIAMSDAVSSEGIWCDICQKQYSKQTVYDGHLNSKKHKAGLQKAGTSSSDIQGQAALSNGPASANVNSKKEIARKEWMISKLGLKFSKTRSATKANVARKQTLTDKEWQAEQSNDQTLALLPTSTNNGDVIPGEEEDGDDPEKIYNPLKLPLGWDGKPIPFWLWRLHGLGVEYPCEICGNHIYMGRKAFDRHFNEWRHVHGLRCLGISGANGLFDQITLIADAVTLQERLEGERRVREKKRDENVEMEDESGNVMSEKVYKDLVAQGIL